MTGQGLLLCSTRIIASDLAPVGDDDAAPGHLAYRRGMLLPMRAARWSLVSLLCTSMLLLGCGRDKKADAQPATTAAAPAPAPVAVDASGLPLATQGLLEFEAALKWESVAPAWVQQRPAWQAAVRAATTPQALAQQLAALETAMGWPGVQETWKTRRTSWQAEVAAVKGASDVARLLVELETQTKWEAVAAPWQQARPGWLQRMQSVR